MPELSVTEGSSTKVASIARVTSVVHRIPPPARRAIVVVLRVLLAAVFLGAAIPKVMDPASFAEDVDNYRMLPDLLIGPVAVALPAVEILIAAALLTGIHAAGAALLAGTLLVGFAAAMVQSMVRGIDLDCGCFGAVAEMRVSGLTVARNVVLTLACVPIVLARRKDELAPPAPEPATGT